jgi:hypothetical protein
VARFDLPTVGGLLLLVIGLAAVVDSGIAREFALSADLVDAVGMAALLGGAITVRLVSDADSSTAEVAPPETRAQLPVPGEDVDELLATIDENPLAAADEHVEIKERLLGVGVALLADRHGLREAEAREALETGVWTDDPHAAAFFVGEYPEWAPVRLQIREWATFVRTPPSMQAGRAVEELFAVANGEYERLERAPERAPSEADNRTPEGSG